MNTDELKVPRLARRTVAFIERRPWRSLLVGFVLVAAMLPGLPRLTADFTHRGFFFADDPMLVAFDAFERQFGNDDAVVVAVHSPSGVFDVETATLLQQLTQRMWRVPQVVRVDSLSNFNWVHAEGDDIIVEPLIPDDRPLTPAILAERERVAMTHETIPDYLVSRDKKTAMIFAAIKPGIDAAPDAPTIVKATRAVTAELTTGDHSFYISGGPAINFAFQESSQQDLSTLMPLALLMAVVFLAVLLRSVAGVLLPLVVIFLSIVATVGFAGWRGIVLTTVVTTLPNILIAIGIADSVHILVTFYRTGSRGVPRVEAARYALLKNFVPTVVTSLTTAAGFFSFVTANLKPVAGLGQMAGFGTLLAWWFTYFVLGALLFILPINAGVIKRTQIHKGDALAVRLVRLLEQHRIAVMVSVSLFALVCVSLSTRNEVNSDPFEYFSPGFPARIANEFIEREVGGARGIELVIDSGKPEGIKDPDFLRRVERLQTWIEDKPRVTRAVSIVDILKSTHRSLNGDDPAAYVLADRAETIGQELFLYTMSLPQGMSLNDRVTLDNRAMRMTVLWTIPTSSETVAAINSIEEHGNSLGLNVMATGKNRLYQSMNGYVTQSFIKSFSIAIVLISILLVVFLKSIGLGLLALLPNLIPLLSGGALLFLIGQPLDIGTVLVASVCLGIAVDDTIHILANYSRLRSEGKSRRVAVEQILAHTAPALLTTTAILVASFGVFLFATFTPNLYFGVLTAFVLCVALVVDCTLLPAVLLRQERRTAPG